MVTRSAPEAFLAFNAASPSTFHCVSTLSSRLSSAGFTLLSESSVWDLHAGGKYFFTRNESALVAFALPACWTSESGISFIGCHSDSCSLVLKPNSVQSKEGYLVARVEPYGGGIWKTWFDRDLGLAGRVVVKGKKGLESRLVDLDWPVGRIPSLAIHLDRAQDTKLDMENHFVPLIGNLNAAGQTTSVLLDLLGSALSIDPREIIDFDLNFYDLQHPALGGVDKEFILASRIDNQMSCFAGVTALIECTESDAFQTAERAWALTVFDNEEIGSVSYAGARSDIIPMLVDRLTKPEQRSICAAKSFMLSCDTAHAVHPNFADKHPTGIKPMLNNGIVLKTNHNVRYATTAMTASIVRQFAEKGQCRPLQNFSVRNGCPCGSTIGPFIANLGIRTVDIGLAQLAMHSVREICGAHDVAEYIKLMKSSYLHFSE